MTHRNDERDPVGRAFARLTMAMEDATAVATEGQNRTHSMSFRLRLASKLRRHLSLCVNLLNQIEHLLASRGDAS